MFGAARRGYGLLGKSKKQPKTGFAIHTRTKGKFKKIAFAQTKEQAFKIAKKRTTESLRASFKVTEIGTGKAVTGFKTNGIFTASKKEKGVFIEKKKFRLSTRGEVGEIKLFKSLKLKKVV